MPFRWHGAKPEPVEFCVWPECDRSPDLRHLDLSFPLCIQHICQAARLWQIEQDRRLLRRASERERYIKRDRQARRLKPEGGWIYYLRVGERVKIGHTTNLDQRLAAYPPDSVLLALHPGTRAREKQLHEQFSVLKRLGREWYAPHPAIDVHVAEVLAEHGSPHKLLAEAREHAKALAMVRRT